MQSRPGLIFLNLSYWILFYDRRLEALKPSKCALKQLYQNKQNQTLRKPFIAMVIVIRSDSPWSWPPEKLGNINDSYRLLWFFCFFWGKASLFLNGFYKIAPIFSGLYYENFTLNLIITNVTAVACASPSTQMFCVIEGKSLFLWSDTS